MHLFYAPSIDFSKDHLLSEEESRHTVKVLRLQKGAEVLVTNGKGSRALARLTDPSLRACRLEILEVHDEVGKRNFFFHLAIAPTKNPDRIEWMLEKATEVGIERITPMITHRSERRDVNHTRLERILIAAMKQSMRSYLPQLGAPQHVSKIIGEASETKKFIAHCLSGTTPLDPRDFSPRDSVLVLIGPEGDFTSPEIEAALLRDFKPLNLGHGRLRTETAGLVVCTQLAYIMQRFGS